MRYHQSARLGLLMISFAFNALAQNSTEEDLFLSYGDEEFISIATGQKQLISKAPAVASIITEQDIKELGALHLDQVLESIPGIHVSLSSLRFSPVYSVRGIHSDANPQVLVLINGVPMTQVYFGDRGLNSSLPVASIKRIEVIRGPGSAVYGADAFSGVINIITKDSQDVSGTEVGVKAGSFNTHYAWLFHGNKVGKLDFFFGLEAYHTDGDRNRIIDQDAQSLFDSIPFLSTDASLAPGPVDTRNQRVDIRVELANADQWTWRYWSFHQRDLGVGPGLAQALDPNGYAESDTFLTDLTFIKDISSWDLQTVFSYMDVNNRSRQRLFPPGTRIPIGADGNVNPVSPVGIVLFTDGLIGNPEIYEKHFRTDFSAIYSKIQNHRFRLAAGFQYAELTPKETKNFGPSVIDGTVSPIGGTLTDVSGTPFVFAKEEDRTVYYASFQDEWSFARDWEFTGGLRVDRYSDFGTTINPRLAMVWDTRYNLTTKFLYGRAFRAPAFAELFAINNPVILGNENLDPEIINTFEVAMNYKPATNLQVDLSLFAYQVKDIIRYVADATGETAMARNTSGQDGNGFELETTWNITSKFKLRANYAFHKAENKETGTDAANAPQQQLYINSQYKFSDYWLLSAEVNHVANRSREAGDPRMEVDDYTLVNVRLERKDVVRRLDVALSVRNLTEEEAFEPSVFDPKAPAGAFVPGDYPLEGRGVFGELFYQF